MKCWSWVPLLAAAPLLCAQQAELDSLVAASARLREIAPSGSGIDNIGKVTRPQWDGLEAILRDWLERRLPPNLAELDARFPSLNAQLMSELQRAGVLAPNADVLGYVSGLQISRPAEYPNALVVQAGVSVPCGSDVPLMIYRFNANSRDRLVAAHGTSDGGNSLLNTRFSAPDRFGNRLFYASWDNVQCAFVWNVMDYRLYRITAEAEQANLLFSGSQSYTIESDVNIALTNEELLLECTAEALEGGFRRTNVLHYSIGAEGVQRIDPVALQAQDFVHEWMLRPWGEMESRSSASLSKWHAFLQAGVGGYDFVQPCQDRPSITQVALGISSLGNLDMPEPLSAYVLVEDKGGYHFKMLEVSFDRQPGCPGESDASYDGLPSLFKKKLPG